MKLARTFLCLLCPLLLAAADAVLAAPTKIIVVTSKEGGAYGEVVQAIQTGLEDQPDIALKVFPLEAFRNADAYVHRPVVIVAIGADAAQRVARSDPPAPILHILLPRDAATEIIRSGRGKGPAFHRDSAIFLDQPIGRQLDLIRAALPKHKRIAIILGPATEQHAAELRAAARERALIAHIAIIKKREDLLPTLEGLLDDNDVLLSVAEPLAYHSETLHHVLLTTYRYKIPMLGLSKTYVDAGALLAIYSTPEQIGRQAAQLLSRAAKGPLPPPAFPKFFTVSINRRVAMSLDLYLDSEEVLQRKLESPTRP